MVGAAEQKFRAPPRLQPRCPRRAPYSYTQAVSSPTGEFAAGDRSRRLSYNAIILAPIEDGPPAGNSDHAIESRLEFSEDTAHPMRPTVEREAI
jgi:hypothetical protein